MIQKITTPYGTARVYRKKVIGTRERILVVPGYSESLSHTREIVDLLAGRGFDSFTFSQPRRKAKAARDVLARNRDIILDVLKTSTPQGGKVHAVAHSFGSAPLLKAAIDNPELFAGLLLMEPSGISGRQGFFSIVRRTALKVVRNNIRTIRDRHLHRIWRRDKGVYSPDPRARSTTTRKLVRAQLSSGYLIAKNPRLALREALTAIRHDISGDIAAVQALGVPVHVVVAHDDELFRMSEDGTSFERILNLPGIYHSLADKQAPHDTFWLHPERTVQTIDSLVRHTAALH